MKQHVSIKHQPESLRNYLHTFHPSITTFPFTQNPTWQFDFWYSAPLSCNVCDDNFQTIYDLKDHILKIYNLTFPCLHCDNKLPENENVLNHHLTFSTKPLQWPRSFLYGTEWFFDVVARGAGLFWTLHQLNCLLTNLFVCWPLPVIHILLYLLSLACTNPL